jgi:HK97 family phage prohead protease
MNLEVRSLVEPPEFRSAGGKLVAAGVAMRYGAKSKPINGQFREVFNPGAFTKTLQEQDVHSHNEHLGPYLGRTRNGSLRLTDTRSELSYEIDLPDTSAGRDAAALLERGDIKGSSIGFRALPKEVTWTVDADGMALRSISAAKLRRVDLTIEPYYPDSTAEMALRSLADNTGLELRSLIEVAARGDLATLILDPDEHRSGGDDGRGTTVHRRPVHWFV